MKTYKGCPVIPAHVVNMSHIIFQCQNHKKKTFVKHGSCGDLTNRLTHRASNCSCEALKDGYYLEIKQNTPRAYLGSINQILKTDQPILHRIWIKQQVKKGTFDIMEN